MVWFFASSEHQGWTDFDEAAPEVTALAQQILEDRVTLDMDRARRQQQSTRD